jgi:hypothetical protein
MTEPSLFYLDFGEWANCEAHPCAQALLLRAGAPRLRPGRQELEQLQQQLALLACDEAQAQDGGQNDEAACP